MAKAKSNSSKVVPAKKNRNALVKEYEVTNEPIRIHITLEVVIRNETATSGQNFLAASEAAGSDRAPNFSFSFDKQNARILKLTVGSYESNLPPDSGQFFTQIFGDQVRVIVYAEQTNPNPYAYFSLKYNDKNLYEPAKSIAFKGAKGEIDEEVKLP